MRSTQRHTGAIPDETAISTNECPSLCRACGGECCRTRPGIESPERFLAAADPAEALFRALASGFWVLSTHYGVPRTPNRTYQPGDADRIIRYPRPATRHEHSRGLILADVALAECVFLGAEGCRLAYEDRPLMCRALEPDVCFECESSWTRLDAALAWLPWQEMVEAALRRQEPREEPPHA